MKAILYLMLIQKKKKTIKKDEYKKLMLYLIYGLCDIYPTL